MELRAAAAFVVALVTTAPFATTRAEARPCGAGCAVQAKACVRIARTSLLSCKMDCRTSFAGNVVGSCIHGCRDTFRSDRGTCGSGRTACVASCEPSLLAPQPGGCFSGCGRAVAACDQGVVTEAQTCVTGCETASDPLTCLRACAAAVKAGGQTCAGDLDSCLAACGVPSAVTTTLPFRPCELSGATGCNGTCPPGLACNAPPTGASPASTCACLAMTAHSPSGAFVR